MFWIPTGSGRLGRRGIPERRNRTSKDTWGVSWGKLPFGQNVGKGKTGRLGWMECPLTNHQFLRVWVSHQAIVMDSGALGGSGEGRPANG